MGGKGCLRDLAPAGCMVIPSSVAMGTLGGVGDGLQMEVSSGQGGEVGAKRGLEELCSAQADDSALQTAPDPAWLGHLSCPPVHP